MKESEREGGREGERERERVKESEREREGERVELLSTGRITGLKKKIVVMGRAHWLRVKGMRFGPTSVRRNEVTRIHVSII